MESKENQSVERSVKNAIEIVRKRAAELRSAVDDLCASFDACEHELLAERASLDVAAELIKKNAAELHEREVKVSRREQEVMNIRQIAANRKAQLETANQIADAANESRRKAEISQRMSETEKARLEETVATLIREKRELATEKARLEQQEVAK